MSARYTLSTVYGDWDGLSEACAARGYSLCYVVPPRPAQSHYSAFREGAPGLKFTTRDAVCDWLDSGAPEALPMWRERAA